MKKFLAVLSIAVLGLVSIGCTNGSSQANTNTAPNTQTTNTNDKKETTDKKKVLIIYYSRSGNTQELAQQIQQQTSGDIVRIEPVKAYPATYEETTKQAKEEQQAGFKPEIKPLNINLQDYDTIYLGSPCWWSNLATPVVTFLSDNDLSGKTIALFMTHGGSGFGRSIEHIKELAPNSTVKEGLAVKSSNVKNAQNDIKNWLAK